MIKTIDSFEDKIFLHHLILKGTNEEIGFQLGEIAKTKHQIDKKSNTTSDIVRNQYRYIQKKYPQHYERMIGFARAYGVSIENHDYDFSYFGHSVNNTSCSAVFYPPNTTENGHGYISRNLDFSIPPDYRKRASSFPFKHSYVMEIYPKKTYPSISLFCFEVFGLSLEGINSEGLAVIHLADADTRIDHEHLATLQTRTGFNEFLPIQYLLDTCSTTREAKFALKEMNHYHMNIPVHLLIADKQGNSFVFEYSHDGTKKVFIDGNKNFPLKITNFQLNRLTDKNLAKKIEENSIVNGFDRYKVLGNRIHSYDSQFTEKLIEEINTDVYVHKDGEDELDRTLFHNIYNLSSTSIKIAIVPTINRSNDNFAKFTL